MKQCALVKQLEDIAPLDESGREIVESYWETTNPGKLNPPSIKSAAALTFADGTGSLNGEVAKNVASCPDSRLGPDEISKPKERQ